MHRPNCIRWALRASQHCAVLPVTTTTSTISAQSGMLDSIPLISVLTQKRPMDLAALACFVSSEYICCTYNVRVVKA